MPEARADMRVLSSCGDHAPDEGRSETGGVGAC